MMPQDRIRFQEFKQISDTEWIYEIITVSRMKYSLRYRVLKTGFIRETMISEGTLLFDREFRCGERLEFVFEDVIHHFGNTSQAIKAQSIEQSQSSHP